MFFLILFKNFTIMQLLIYEIYCYSHFFLVILFLPESRIKISEFFRDCVRFFYIDPRGRKHAYLALRLRIKSNFRACGEKAQWKNSQPTETRDTEIPEEWQWHCIPASQFSRDPAYPLNFPLKYTWENNFFLSK